MLIITSSGVHPGDARHSHNALPGMRMFLMSIRDQAAKDLEVFSVIMPFRA